MDDIAQFLNLKPEEIESISISRNNNTTFIDLTLTRKQETCPVCGGTKIYGDGKKLRILNHPILTCGKCVIRYRAKRYRCQYCGKTFYETNSFCEPGVNYTRYAYMKVLEDLKDPHKTFKGVGNSTYMSTSEIINIFDGLGIAVRQSFPEVICIDEYHDPSTGSGKYTCVLMNWHTNEVVDVLPDRSKRYLHKYLQLIPKTELDKVKHISIDMWQPYKDIAEYYFKNAKISIDSFHVVKHITDALDKVRLRIMRKYSRKDKEYYLLNKFDWLLLMNYSDIYYNEPEFNRRLKMYLNYHEILNLILKIDPEIELVHNLKEMYHHFNKEASYEEAPSGFYKIINEFKKSGIPELLPVAKMLSHWSTEILNSFYRFNGRRISNGPVESLNSRIRLILKNANGYCNFERERNRIFYCINKKWTTIPETEIRFIKRVGRKRQPYVKKLRDNKKRGKF